MSDEIAGKKVKCVDTPVSNELVLTKVDRWRTYVLEHCMSTILNLVVAKNCARPQDALLDLMGEATAACLTSPGIPVHTRVASTTSRTGDALPADTTYSVSSVITGIGCQWFWFKSIWHSQRLWPLLTFSKEARVVGQILGCSNTVDGPESAALAVQTHPSLLEDLCTWLIALSADKSCGFSVEITLLWGW